MTEKEVYNKVIEWINNLTGLTTIKSHQNAPRPNGPYLMVSRLNTRSVYQHEIDVEYIETNNLNSEGKFEIEASPILEMEWEFSLHSYGDDCTEPLRKVQSLYRSGGINILSLANLVVHEVGTINNVPDWINNSWEDRAHTRLFVRGLVRDTVLTDVIDDVTFNKV